MAVPKVDSDHVRWEIRQGRNFVRTFAIRNSDGSYRDFTGSTISCSFTPQGGSAVAATCSIVDHPTTGDVNAGVRIRLPGTVTDAMLVMTYSFDIKIIPPGGTDDDAETPFSGTARVLQEVTE